MFDDLLQASADHTNVPGGGGALGSLGPPTTSLMSLPSAADHLQIDGDASWIHHAIDRVGEPLPLSELQRPNAPTSDADLFGPAPSGR